MKEQKSLLELKNIMNFKKKKKNDKMPQELIFDLVESSEKITQIEEVVIKSQKTLSGKEILEKAKLNVESNYIQSPYNQKFYVSVNRYNEKDTLFYTERALVETFNKNGLNSSNNAEKGIFGEILQYKSHTKNSKKDKWGGVGNLWVQLNRDIILSKAEQTRMIYAIKKLLNMMVKSL